jgi:hypothetical protein
LSILAFSDSKLAHCVLYYGIDICLNVKESMTRRTQSFSQLLQYNQSLIYLWILWVPLIILISNSLNWMEIFCPNDLLVIFWPFIWKWSTEDNRPIIWCNTSLILRYYLNKGKKRYNNNYSFVFLWLSNSDYNKNIFMAQWNVVPLVQLILFQSKYCISLCIRQFRPSLC